MNSELVVDVKASEISIALLEDKRLVELNQEGREEQFAVGNIYFGRVKKIMPGLNAAFVDVGYEKDAFLHYLDLGSNFNTFTQFTTQALSDRKKAPAIQKTKLQPELEKNGSINDILKTGMDILVQVTKEPISTKGPRLTSEISIAGRNLVLIPFSDKVSVSQKIESSDERSRLKTLLHSIKPKNFGVIVRTVAESKKVAELDVELKGLVRKWENAFEQLKDCVPPRIILSELKRTSAILRDILNASFNNVYVNDDSIYTDIREYISTIAPEKEKIVKLYEGTESIFEHFSVDKQLKGSFGKTVSFKSGAYLVIEHTEALHVVDVNSGNRSKSAKDQETNALETNLAAADEISRQLRLRDMGGIIVIDFIDMHENENRQKVYDRMKENMGRDRTKHNILPLSKFGLMQITRQRVRPEMNIDVLEKCPTCNGSGEIAPSVLLTDQIEAYLSVIAENKEVSSIELRVHPFVAAFLTGGFISIRRKWTFKYKIKIKINPVSSYQYLQYRFFNREGEAIVL